ncbi:FMN-dependent NADH-azoreductase [Chitinophaga skermanii]|uniref:FMN dependent NADH:quinone oxidoreductase n=1 Tax=Chitinophaga skermanii TaxID=331697 RepID=A0A327QX27_9BACT|nr:NAD(P)H-dependent oxidoreductase [Chitinophaga skermanii]RAJ08891.1 FMN-dependent NADH-azoreductase [Chitinophaga skermanii]
MKKILHIISSPRIAHSASRKLGNATLEKLMAKYPGSAVIVRDLAKDPAPHLDEVHIVSFFTPADSRTAEQLDAIRYSEEAVTELLNADIIVIEAPMYNFTITSTLKAYFDHIIRAGMTIKIRGGGLLPEGLLTNKEAYIVTSSGSVYSEGDLKDYDFVEPFIRAFLSVIGIKVAGVFRAEGQAVVGLEAALENGFDSIAAWE